VWARGEPTLTEAGGWARHGSGAGVANDPLTHATADDRDQPKEGVMATPVPALRQVTVEILSTLGWLHGTLHVPVAQTLLDFFTLSSQLITATRVHVPHEPDLLGFVALRRDSITLIAPTLSGPLMQVPASHGPTTPRDVACLLDHDVLRGQLDVTVNLRLSDHLRQHGPYLILRHCMLAPYGATLQSPESKTLEAAIVNLNRVAGVSEA